MGERQCARCGARLLPIEDDYCEVCRLPREHTTLWSRGTA